MNKPITNSKPTEQAERCQTLVMYYKTEMKIIKLYKVIGCPVLRS